MHLMLHIFKKDFRRLWWAVAITLLLLADLAREDHWRYDYQVGATEGWLSLLVPLAWATLIALLVHEESLAGDRQFWITRPYSWISLLAEKILFVVLFVHIPSLVADAFILSSHDIPPSQYITQLLGKQVLLAAILTLPAIALAALLKNIAHVLLAVILLAGAAGYLAGMADRFVRITTDQIPRELSALILALASAVIIVMQYRRRQTVPSRVVGIAAVLSAGLVFGYLPPIFVKRLQATLHPAHKGISLRVSTPQSPPKLYGPPKGDSVQLALPITLSGSFVAQGYQWDTQTAEIIGPDGQRYRSASPAQYNNGAKVDLEFSLRTYQNESIWVIMTLRRSIMQHINDGKVSLRLRVAFSAHRRGATTWMPIGGVQTVPGVGRCRSSLVEGQSFRQEELLKVVCESPDFISLRTEAKLWQPETGREWKQYLFNGGSYLSGPRVAWLSPLNRLQAFFQLHSNMDYVTPDGRWLVPPEALSSAKLAITPDIITGWSVMDFELHDVKLRDYIVQPNR